MEYHGRKEHQFMSTSLSTFSRHARQGGYPRLSLFAFMSGLTFSGSALASQPAYYEKPVQFSGTIVYEQFYGLPNFGEDPKTDAKVNVIELKLDEPINVFPSGPIQFIEHHCVDVGACTDALLNSASFQGVTRVGLIDLDDPALGLEKLGGRHVVLSGTLFEQQDALQFNKVLMIVKSVAERSETAYSRTTE